MAAAMTPTSDIDTAMATTVFDDSPLLEVLEVATLEDCDVGEEVIDAEEPLVGVHEVPEADEDDATDEAADEAVDEAAPIVNVVLGNYSPTVSKPYGARSPRKRW